MISILVNCIVRWKDVLQYVKKLLVRIRQRKHFKEVDQDNDYGVNQLFEDTIRGRRGRRVNRLPDDLDD